ncbi:MAG: hypothetical protein A3J67_01405 [Parcubacteria group bacterium RIFCSPHIGHO2_02_FULL_48_10b]|nr:MAG: hypothetical protein A3J67_01405 [Parcubacteria group bacterium RIFCSPHIGHO2_02_FULL_48_10b]
MARVIAVCNQKGGVGKTTTVINLSAYLALLGRKILLVDFDPQANATSTFGIDPRTIEKSVYHGLFGEDATALVKPSTIFNYHFIPASVDLAGALVELVNETDREFLLRKFLMPIRHHYDYIIIDLPPSLGLLTVNGLVAADELIIPVQCEYYSLEGLGQLLSTIELVQTNLRHQLKIAGALLTMYDRRERLSRDVAKELRRHFPHRVYEIEIPKNVQLAESPSFSKTILEYAPGSKGARAYERLAREIIQQEQ